MTTKNLHFWKELNIFLILFFLCTFFAFLFLNGTAFWTDLRYSLFLKSPFASSDLKNGDLLQVVSAAGGDVADLNGALTLVIPKINVVVPIVIPGADDKATVLATLEKGVGLYPGSTPPGGSGRAVLLGHSSKASWYHGNYAYIFTLLSKLDPPDEFYITTATKKYVYQVAAHKTLSPKDTNILLAGPSAASEVDLVTCYPVGSASQRTIIQGVLLRTDSI
jgi:LPXTG-site transpeptidase (sortase) family protein